MPLSRYAQLVPFAFEYLGAQFVSRYIDTLGIRYTAYLALAIGLLAVVLFFANLVVLGLADKHWRTLLIWLPLAAYSGASGLLVGLSRISAGMRDSGPYFSWYASISVTFWVSFVAVAITLIASGRETAIRQLLAWVNLGVLAGLAVLFVVQNSLIPDTSLVNPAYAYASAGTPINDNCAAQYVQTLDGGCLAEYAASTDVVAAYRLNVFATLRPVNIVAGYQPTDIVLVETETAVQSLHVRDWLLEGVAVERLYFVIPQPDDALAVLTTPRPLENVIAAEGVDAVGLAQELAATGQPIWYVRKQSHATTLDSLWLALASLGYSETQATVHTPGEFVVIRFGRR